MGIGNYIKKTFGKKDIDSNTKIELAKKNCVELEYLFDNAINEADTYKQDCLTEMEGFYRDGVMDQVNEMAYNAGEMDEMIDGYKEQKAIIKTTKIELGRPMVPDTKIGALVDGVDELTKIVNDTKDSNKMGDLSKRLYGLKTARGLVRALGKESTKKIYTPAQTVKAKADAYVRNCAAKIEQERMALEGKEAIIQQGLNYQNLPVLEPADK